MVCGGLMSWFVVVQYLPDNLKIGVVSLKSQLQLMWWFVVVRGAPSERCGFVVVHHGSNVMVCHGSIVVVCCGSILVVHGGSIVVGRGGSIMVVCGGFLWCFLWWFHGGS